MANKLSETRELLENNLFEFAKYLNPHYLYSDVHEEVFNEMQFGNHNKLLFLLPRAHLKSHCVAVHTVWMITRDPTITIVYLSAVETLAIIQVEAIKNMFESDEYKLIWPEMFHPEVTKRDKWSAFAINVDHPARRAMGIRDYTLIIRTNKGASTGLHCDHLVFDDIVTDENAYHESGRQEVSRAVGKFVAIKNPNASTMAVGTRYHPNDIYAAFKESMVPVVDEQGQILDTRPDWKIVEHAAEQDGHFLWPRTAHPVTGRWYGFNHQVLAVKKAEYDSVHQTEQFYAQYYNEPNDPDSYKVARGNFHYYNPKKLKEREGSWFYGSDFDMKKLSVFAAMDLAWSDRNKGKRDFTAVAVIGVDYDGFIYILELDQWQSSDYDLYFNAVSDMAQRWGFRQIRVESNAAGTLVAKELTNRVRERGMALIIDAKAKTSHDGKKHERWAAVLEPRYKSNTILHRKGGLTQILEEQIMMARPKNDDLKDALCEAIEISRVPAKRAHSSRNQINVIPAHSRFGGRRMMR